jgi:hypothetical protein
VTARVSRQQGAGADQEASLQFFVEPEAEPGDVLAALARLLLSLAERKPSQVVTRDGESSLCNDGRQAAKERDTAN